MTNPETAATAAALIAPGRLCSHNAGMAAERSGVERAHTTAGRTEAPRTMRRRLSSRKIAD
jgi:hypothetical protein